MDVKRLYLTFSQVFPERYKPGLQKKLLQAGIDEDVNVWAGRAVTTVVLLAFAAAIFPFTFMRYQPIGDIDFSAMPPERLIPYVALPLFLLTGLLIAFLYYMYLFYRVQNRADAIEKVLPDFLMIVVSNLHAGMSPFSAFVSAARPEFGALEEEVKKVSARSSSSQSLAVALTQLSQSFDSQIFQKTITFFEKAVRSGGQMAKILHASAEEIRHIQEMREDLVSQTKSYVVFLGFMMVMIAPFLFAVSGQFLTMFLKIKSQTAGGGPAGFDTPIFQGKIELTPGFVDHVGFGFLVLASMFISLFVGSIMKGKPLYGLKYFPLIAIGSVVMYVIAKGMVAGLLSSFG
ncbi:Type II secretion system (T2SS), protein F [uncultured archaeon]|nr:Type II secretion system (T2SS), protein F [uncultured archaeon]